MDKGFTIKDRKLGVTTVAVENSTDNDLKLVKIYGVYIKVKR